MAQQPAALPSIPPLPTPTYTDRYAVVTGANRGIGFEISKQLASTGVTVIFTSRNNHTGLQALQTLQQQLGLTHNLLFHQLDILDPRSIDALVQFITTNCGKLDILVNNAGVSGIAVEGDPLVLLHRLQEDIALIFPPDELQEKPITPDDEVKKANGKITQTVEDAHECIGANFYGSKRVTEALIPLLQLSDSPRIVNVSSMLGVLKISCNEWGKQVLSNQEQLTEENVDQLVSEFLKDFKEGSLEANGWPTQFAAYKVSKAALNAYTRTMAKKHPEMRINCVCPGFARTDMTIGQGPLSAAEAAENVVAVAMLPDGGPSGLFFLHKEIMSF